MRGLAVKLTEALMRLMPLTIDPDTTFHRIAQLDLESTSPEILERMYAAAQDKHDSEFELSFLDMYFGNDIAALLRGKSVLDLGCSVGGRSVAWNKRLEFSVMYGVDILVQDLKVARDFAAAAGQRNEYVCARAESLPFRDSSIDVVLSYDTFEHVERLDRVLGECRRIIAPGGYLVAVFPPFYNPLESHLLVSNMPCLHWVVSGETMTAAQYHVAIGAGWPEDILPRTLAPWEKLPTLNGTGVAAFDALVGRGGWEVAYRRLCPLFTTGRRAHRQRVFRLLRRLCAPLVFVPVVREYFTDRVVYVLRKPMDGRVS